jgi:RHS repeat-associated protein
MITRTGEPKSVAHYNWQGRIEFVTSVADGRSVQCNVPSAPPIGQCVNITWPATTMTFGMIWTDRQHDPGWWWWGTTVNLRQNASGGLDMRNRVYDPETGRFTQEDPIGLAGGLNLYGFAGGDAVNFSDPFGLCPLTGTDESCFQLFANWGARTGRAWAVNLGAGLEVGAQMIQALNGGGCGEYACGMGVPAGPGGAFRSFRAFKEIAGPAGPSMHWHHIVGQTANNIERFGPEAIHSADNLIAVDASTHARISGFYSSKQAFTGGQTVRDWLAKQTFEEQREFGLRVLRDFGVMK